MADEAPNELEQVRARRKAQQADDAGSYALAPLDLDNTDVGIMNDDDHPVCFIFDPTRKAGVCMSAEDALKLAEQLNNAARRWLFGDDDGE